MEDVGRHYIVAEDGRMYGGGRSGWSDMKGDVYDTPYVVQNTHYHHDDDRRYYDQPRRGVSEEIGEECVDEEVPETGEHLTSNDVYGVQTAFIYPKIRGSLEEWANNPDKTVWTMSPKNLSQIRHNIRTVNRANATEEEFTGDLSRAVLLGARVINTKGKCPTDVGFNLSGLEPRVFTDNNRYAWLVPGDSGNMQVNESIFTPDSTFSRYMYERVEKCDLKSLDQQMRFDIGADSNHALVDKRGYAWQVIMRNTYSQTHWAPYANELYAMNNDMSSRFAEVVKPIAEEVYGEIKADLENIGQHFVDLRTLEVKFERDDGEAWNQTNSLVGESMAFDEKSKLRLQDHTLNKQNEVGAMIELKFVLY